MQIDVVGFDGIISNKNAAGGPINIEPLAEVDLAAEALGLGHGSREDHFDLGILGLKERGKGRHPRTLAGQHTSEDGATIGSIDVNDRDEVVLGIQESVGLILAGPEVDPLQH